MEELGCPKVLANERLGHEDGSVSARYTHGTDTMRALLMDQLTEVWHKSLDDRLLLAPRSPAPILDRLLQQRAAERWHPVSRSHPDYTQIQRSQGRSP
ncbi:hypothetical protein ACQ5JZ_02845 [Streptomyces sp. ZG43]|nr:LacI family transcriptional regulator [Streptomyces sp. PVA_94-07]